MVVIHDERLDRTTEGTGFVRDIMCGHGPGILLFQMACGTSVLII